MNRLTCSLFLAALAIGCQTAATNATGDSAHSSSEATSAVVEAGVGSETETPPTFADLPRESIQRLAFAAVLDSSVTEYVNVYGTAPASIVQLIEEEFLFFLPIDPNGQVYKLNDTGLSAARHLSTTEHEGQWEVTIADPAFDRRPLRVDLNEQIANSARPSDRWYSESEAKNSRLRKMGGVSLDPASQLALRSYLYRSPLPQDRRLGALSSQVENLFIRWSLRNQDAPASFESMLTDLGMTTAGGAWLDSDDPLVMDDADYGGTIMWNPASHAIRLELRPGLPSSCLREIQGVSQGPASMRSESLPPSQIDPAASVQPLATFRLVRR